MTEGVPQNLEISNTDEGDSRIIHGFHPIAPDLRTSSIAQKGAILDSDARVYKKIEEFPIQPKEQKPSNKLTILSTTFILTYFCLGTTIFTFAVRAKSFGLFWILVCCIIVGIINYWTIMRGSIVSFKYKDINYYSEMTERIIGKKAKIILNILIILYSYACMICFLALIFPLSGRIILIIFYNNKFETYEEFEKKKWGKSYIKLPFFFAVTFIVSVVCLIKDHNKLNFLSYIGVITVFYTLFVVMVQCNDYYNYYKETKYKREDKNTHPNWFDLGKAFSKDLDFFKGMANLFCAYAIHPRIYPVCKGFKTQKDGLKKMRYGVFFAICLTTAFHIISIVCSFLTDPYTPEDLIIFRKNKGKGKDIAMTISKLFVVLSLIFTIPGYCLSLRSNIVNSFNKGILTDRFNYFFTFGSCLGCAIIAAIYDKILNYLTYIGGFISVFICYLYPILIYVFSTEKKLKDWKNIIEIILAVILCIIGVIAGIITIIDDIKN